jgi:MFS family permease
VGLPAWSERLGLADGEGGALLAAYGAGAFAAVLAGLWGIRGLTFRPGLAVMGAGAALLAWAPAWGAALGAAVVLGLGFGIVVTVVNRRFLHDFGERGPGMLGLVNAVTGLGAIAAPLLAMAAGGPGPVLLGLAALCVLTIPLGTPEPPRPSAGLPPWGTRASSSCCSSRARSPSRPP